MTEDRWKFLEDVRDACAVVSPRMELLFLNAPGRALVPETWFGSHCWQAFPVVDQSCSVRCEAVRAVREAEEIIYCQEVIEGSDGTVRTLGVAVIPAGAMSGPESESILILRPCPADPEDAAFKKQLLADASQMLRDLTGHASAGSGSRAG